VLDLEIHQRLFVCDWPRWKLAQVQAEWIKRNPAHELVFSGTRGKNFTGMIEWRER
jgi:hypothetical protein